MEKVICDCCGKECKNNGYLTIATMQRFKNGEIGRKDYQICRNCLKTEEGQKTLNLMTFGVSGT